MNRSRLRLGELLVESGVLSEENLKTALEIQKNHHLRLGMILLREGFVNENNLLQSLSRHLAIPWVSIWRIDIPESVYNLVPVNVAEEHFLFPIYIQRNKDGEQSLYVGMNDPEDEEALRFVSATAGMTAKPMIAAPSDIAAAIRYYYYQEEYVADVEEKSAPHELPIEAIQPVGQVGPDGEVEDLTDHMESESIIPEAPANDDDTNVLGPSNYNQDNAPTPDTRSVSSPPPDEFNSKESAQKEAERRIYGVGREKATRDFAITLLDGTKLSFGPSAPAESADDLPMTEDEFLKTLDAAAQGSPVEGLLPADQWQHYVAAIAKLLISKGLVSYKELYQTIANLGDPS